MKLKLILWMLTFTILSTLAFATLDDAELYYSFDDDDLIGSNPIDLSGNGNNATNNGATTGVTGKINEAFDFDGINDYVDTNIDTFDFSTSSINIWFKNDITFGNELSDIFYIYEDSSNRFGLTPHTAGAGDLYFYGNNGGTAFNTYIIDDAEFNDQGWNMFTVTSDSSNKTLVYINGNLSTSFNGSNIQLPSITGGTVYIAGDENGYFDGVIDEFSIYNRSLSESEISQLYNSGIGYNPYSALDNFSIIVTDSWDSSDINNVTANITLNNGTSYIFTNTTGNYIQTTIPSNITQLANITISNYEYFDSYYRNVNMSSNLNAEMNQSQISFLAKDILGNYIPSGNITISSTKNLLNYTWGLKSASYNATFSSYQYLNKTQEFSVSALDNKTITIENITNSVLRFNNTYGEVVPNATITVTYPDLTEFDYITDVNGQIYFTTVVGGILKTGIYNFTFNELEGYDSPKTFSYTVNTTNFFLNETYTIDNAGFNISVYDRESGEYINNSIVTIVGYGSVNITDGNLLLRNASLTSGRYTLYAFKEGYDILQLVFSYDQSEIEQINFYLINSTGTTTGTLLGKSYDEFYNEQSNVDMRLLEWSPDTNSFLEVSQCFSNSNGECFFNVEIGVKLYKLTASRLIDGIIQQAQSSENGEFIYIDNYQIDLHLYSTGLLPVDDLLGFYMEAEDKELINNVSYLTGVFYDIYENEHQVCIRYSYINGTQKVQLSGGLNCITDTSGEINVFGGYNLTSILSTNSVYVELFVNQSGNEIVYFSDIYTSSLSFQEQAGDIAPYLIMFLWCAILSIAIYLKNVYFFAIGNIISSLIARIMLPYYFNWQITSILIILSIILFYFARKEEGNISV